MACGPGEEERVTALAAELDAVIRGLKKRVGEIGDRRIAVMAGLTVLDRLKDAEERISDLEERIARLERAREEAALAAEAEDEPLIERLDAAAAVVERLARTLVGQTHALSEEDAPAAFSHARAGSGGAAAASGAVAAAADEQTPTPEDTVAGGDDEDFPEFMMRS